MHHEPFGDLTWQPHAYLSRWEGVVSIPGLRDCRMRWDHDGTELQDDRSESLCQGRFPLTIYSRHSDSTNNEMHAIGPYSEQANAYKYLIENESSLVVKLLSQIAPFFVEYFAECFREEGAGDSLIERVSTPNGIRETLHLNNVVIHNKFLDNCAYVGFGFSCSWEQEHGVGVLFHRDRIVEIGGEDTTYNPSAWGDDAIIEE